MYTGSVVKVRVFAFVLALAFAATPLLGVVCQMDCDQPVKSLICHESTTSDGARVRSANHPCDHDHMGGSPALVTGAAGARDSIETGRVSVAVSALVHATVPDVRTAMTDMHGPPGISGRSVSSRTSVLRI